jgi:hypothetical protein
MASEQKIITASTPAGLNARIKKYQKEGWHCVGEHKTIQLTAQLRYAGKQHIDTQHTAEYSQSIRRNIDV